MLDDLLLCCIDLAALHHVSKALRRRQKKHMIYGLVCEARNGLYYEGNWLPFIEVHNSDLERYQSFCIPSCR